jgi:LysM repeat protein
MGNNRSVRDPLDYFRSTNEILKPSKKSSTVLNAGQQLKFAKTLRSWYGLYLFNFKLLYNFLSQDNLSLSHGTYSQSYLGKYYIYKYNDDYCCFDNMFHNTKTKYVVCVKIR